MLTQNAFNAFAVRSNQLINFSSLLLKRQKFQSNVATSNFDRSGVDFRQIIVSQSAVRQLAAQAETCLGEEASSEQTSQVQVDISFCLKYQIHKKINLLL